MTPQNGQNEQISVSKIYIFGIIYQPIELKIQPKVRLLWPKTQPKHFLNNFEKVQKTSFWLPKCSKMTPQNGKILSENFDFQDHLSTFRGVNTPKIRPFKIENNTQTLHKLQNNFEKVQDTTLSTPKTRVSTLQKVLIFWSNFGVRTLKFPLWHQLKVKKSFPLIAKDILKT